MLTIYILIFFFITSLCAVGIILMHSMLKVKKDVVVDVNYDMYPIISLYVEAISKKIIKYLIKTLRFLFIIFKIKVKPILKKIYKIFLNYYYDFFNSVNGKDEIKKKGAASFFFKAITQHIKDIKRRK